MAVLPDYNKVFMCHSIKRNMVIGEEGKKNYKAPRRACLVIISFRWKTQTLPKRQSRAAGRRSVTFEWAGRAGRVAKAAKWCQEWRKLANHGVSPPSPMSLSYARNWINDLKVSLSQFLHFMDQLQLWARNCHYTAAKLQFLSTFSHMHIHHWSVTLKLPSEVTNSGHLVRRQCFNGKLWILVFMWVLPGHFTTHLNYWRPSTSPSGIPNPNDRIPSPLG